MKVIGLAIMAISFFAPFTRGIAQTRNASPFNTITRKHNSCIVSEGSNINEEDSVGDSMDETEVADVTSDSIRNWMPMVALPLKSIHINSPFGIRRDPMNRKSRRMHNGLDLRAKFEEVFSMLPGVVTAASYSSNGGYYVTVNHGACVCSYLHLSKIIVKVGQHVSAGQTIAISGNSGRRTTGAHLHLSCRLGGEHGKFFNPMVILGFVSRQLLDYASKK